MASVASLTCLSRLATLDDMGPHDELAAAREQVPGWDIHETFGGYLAVPHGTPVMQAMYLDTLIEKIKGES